MQLNGVLYAPAGSVTLNGNDTVNGAVVGQTVVINGSNTVTWNQSVVETVPVQQPGLIP
ncbi:DUF7305 domain-containing protein [Methylacidiphilum caldifontis]